MLPQDAADKLAAFIFENIQPATARRWLVVVLSSRIANIGLADRLNEELVHALDELAFYRDRQGIPPEGAEERAGQKLDEIVRAGQPTHALRLVPRKLD